jgi:hypothetical protein
VTAAKTWVQLSRIASAIREEVGELEVVGAGFLALWLAVGLIAAFVVLLWITVS